MSPAFPTRRRADEFHALVSDPTANRSSGPAGLVDLLDVVAELRALPPVSPRPEFSASLRERLMVEADTALATLPPAGVPLALSPRRRARDRRIATLIGGAALLGATTSMAVAAQSALPGDSLYPVKRALEDVEAGLAGDDSALGQALLDNASGRLLEVNALALRGTDDGIAAVPDTLVEFSEQSLEGSEILLRTYDETGDEDIIVQLRDFTHDSMETLLALEAQVPARARDELVEAARTLTLIDDRARSACPSCGGAGITEIPPFLLSVAALPTADVTQAADPSTRPLRPTPAGPARRGAGDQDQGEHEAVSLPVVELHDRGSSAEDTPEDETPEDAPDQGTRDPVRELTTTLTKPENASTQKPLTNLLDRVGGELDETVEDPVDTLLD